MRRNPCLLLVGQQRQAHPPTCRLDERFGAATATFRRIEPRQGNTEKFPRLFPPNNIGVKKHCSLSWHGWVPKAYQRDVIPLVMSSMPLILSPALPSELLTYIVRHETHPTTLVICSSRAEFLSSLISDVQNSAAPSESANTPPAPALLAAPIYQVAVARHVRMVFVPTVSHLRAFLSVFSSTDSKIPPPPDELGRARAKKPPRLLVYGFSGLHRDTSEWSAQGISATAAALVEAARRSGFGAVLVDAPRENVRGDAGEEGGSVGSGDEVGVSGGNVAEESMLAEEIPVLSASVVRAGGELDDAAWTSRKVTLGRVLGRWFQYRDGGWARQSVEGIFSSPRT